MGGTTFKMVAKGKTAQGAFDRAVMAAQREHGHGGYTGTIAEKGHFVMIQPDPGKTAGETADRLMDADDRRIADKWGPAGCIALGNGEWLFFGWAST